jgi:hypothetical protein
METGQDYGAWPAHMAPTWPAQLRVWGVSVKKKWTDRGARLSGLTEPNRYRGPLPQPDGNRVRESLGGGGGRGAHRRRSSAAARGHGGSGSPSRPPWTGGRSGQCPSRQEREALWELG